MTSIRTRITRTYESSRIKKVYTPHKSKSRIKVPRPVSSGDARLIGDLLSVRKSRYSLFINIANRCDGQYGAWHEFICFTWVHIFRSAHPVLLVEVLEWISGFYIITESKLLLNFVQTKIIEHRGGWERWVLEPNISDSAVFALLYNEIVNLSMNYYLFTNNDTTYQDCSLGPLRPLGPL